MYRNRFSFVTVLLLLAVSPAVAEVVDAASSPRADEPSAERKPATPRVKWEFSQRSRYTALFNQFRPGLSGDDQALALRSTFRLDVPFRRVVLLGEIQDARAYLTDSQSNVSTALVNALDVLQAHVRFGGGATAAPAAPEVQIGRFSMEVGDSSRRRFTGT
jgi:hypothetical protein